MAADSIYHKDNEGLGKTAELAGDVVLYGNQTVRSASNLVSRVSTGTKFFGLPGAVVGLVYGAVENMVTLHKYIENKPKLEKKWRDIYATDPYGYGSGKQLSLPGTKPSVKEDTKLSTREPVPDEGGSLPSVQKQKVEVDGENMVKNGKKKQAINITVKAPGAPKQKAKKASNEKKRAKAQRVSNKVAAASFGPVTSVNTAPVAIGNSIRGCKSQVIQTPNGVRLIGRDFMFTPIGTGTVTTWTLCGGTPLTPAAFADTTIANYARIYSKFKFRRVVVHYITSSATSTSGDVMFYYGKDRSSVFLNQTSSQLLGFVMSDPDTTLGPQWLNHSAALTVTGGWKLTDYGMHDGVEEYADGEVFLLSKTTSEESPGYVLFDYDIEFAEHQLQPRSLTLPITRTQWFQCNVGLEAEAVTIYQSIQGTRPLKITGVNISGTASGLPSGSTYGDIYKIVVDVTNSDSTSWVNCTPATIWRAGNAADTNAVTITDGMTLYGVHVDSNTTDGLALYLNPTQAFNANEHAGMCYGVGNTVTYNVQVWISYIGSCGPTTNLIPNF